MAFENLELQYEPKYYGIIFCIGYTDMNRLRESRMVEAVECGYKVISYMHPTAIIQTEDIGIGNIFMEGTIIGQGCSIGNGNVF